MRIVAHAFPKIYHPSPLNAFLEIAPEDPAALQKAQDTLKGRSYPRESLVEALIRYNQSIGNDAIALNNAKKLGQEGNYCVVTGQQLGFMGGPLYTVLKGITCLALAKKTNAIPVFWLATEDHDVSEIDHTYILNPLGNLQQFQLSLPKEGRFVEDLVLNEKNLQVIRAFLQECGNKTPVEMEAAPVPYASFMAGFLARLFAGTGMVFLEPKLLRPLAVPFFEKELKEEASIRQLLRGATERLVEAGGEAILEFKGGTNLFWKREGLRRKISPEQVPEALQLLHRDPTLFSANAAARTVLQSILLPVLAYVAGPTEIKYHRQLRDYFAFHGVAMPWIYPRLSATFLPPFAAQLLEKCNLNPWDDLPVHWNQLFPSLEKGVAEVVEKWNATALNTFKEDLLPESIQRYAKQGLRKLARRVVKSRLKRRDLPSYALHYLQNLIRPHQQPQDRLLNWWGFQAQSEENLVLELLKHTENSLADFSHRYCYL